MSIRLLCLGLLACIASLVGCVSKAPIPTLPPQSPEDLIRRLREEDPKVQTLQAFGSLKWNRQGDKGSVDDAIIIQRPDGIRLEALAPLGSSSMFSMTIRGGEVELFAPNDSRAYRGMVTPQLLERLFALPLKLDEALGVMCGRVPLCPVEKATVQVESGLLLLDVSCQEQGWQQRIRLDPSLLDPVGFNLLAPSGQVILSVSWAGHRQFGKARIPMEIQAEMPLKENRLSLRLKDVEVNVPIPREKFQLILPPGTEIQPLS